MSDSQNTRVPLKTKIGWGAGGFFENTVGNSIAVMALPIFNIALGLSPVWLGWAMSIPRILDAITDPVFGTLSDNTRTRWGRRRPWMFFAGIITPLCLAMMWSVPTHFSQMAIFVWFTVFCTLTFILGSAYSIPYNALGFELSPYYNERTSVQSWRFFFIACSGLLVGWLYRFSLFPLFTGVPVEGVKPEVIGMRNLMWILTPLLILVALCPAFFSRETTAIESQPKIGLRDGFRMTLRNRPFIIFILLGLFSLTGGAIVGPFGLYLGIFYVCDGSKELASTIAGVGTILNTLLSFALIPVVGRISSALGKKETLIIAQIVLIAASFLTWVLYTPAMPWLMVAAIPFNCFALTCFLILNGSVLADICDYDELNTGLRREGMYGAVAAFIGKMAASSIGILSGYMLLWAGYVTEASITDDVLQRMRIMYVLVPAGLGLIGLLLTLAFPLTKKRCLEIREQLNAAGPATE
ncbi:MAG: MFS transporter [Chthoniobacterales bacterium]|nr:MFS transporter [Chthoniobacterales bacterium]